MAFIEIDGGVGVLTGAGSGIGRATALELARAACASSSATSSATAPSRPRRWSPTSAARPWGFAPTSPTPADLEALREACLGHFGALDLVMNNVGVIAMGPPESLPLVEWQRVVDVNLLGIVRSNLVFLPHLIEQGRGHVVNTASVSGLLAHGFDRLPYVTTKHAVVGMTESLALYLRPQGIGVTCVCPSGVATNIVEQISFFGPATRPRSPDHPIVEAEVVGRLVADAVESDRFLVLTVPEVVDELIERATDIERYVHDRSQPEQEHAMSDDTDARRAAGEAMFEEVNGFAAPAPGHPFIDMTVDHVFGEVWTRPGLTRKERRWIAITGVASAGRRDGAEGPRRVGPALGRHHGRRAPGGGDPLRRLPGLSAGDGLQRRRRGHVGAGAAGRIRMTGDGPTVDRPERTGGPHG